MSPDPARIAIALVDDDPKFRELVRETLGPHPDLWLCAQFAESGEAIRSLPDLMPDIVLMDIEMPGISGIDCVRRLHLALPGTRFMMLTVFEDHDRIFESLEAGATGYLIKRGVTTRLSEAIRDLHAGEFPISPAIARKIIRALVRPDPLAELSQRERAVLERLAAGCPYKEIAKEFGVSFNTIRTHVNRIYEKLHVHSRQEAAARLTKPPDVS